MTTPNDFTDSVSQNFATPGNWSLGHVANSGEDAEIEGFAVESNTETVASIGTASGDALTIDDGASLFAPDGTGPNANDGSISMIDADLFIGNGTFDNPGTIALDGVSSALVPTLAVTGSITLEGGGQIEMAIGPEGQAGPADNLIVGDNVSTTPTLLNLDNTISGDGTIEGLNFINDGFVDTNNSSSTNGGIIQFENGGEGSFTNNNYMTIDSGGEFLFGAASQSTLIDNRGVIQFQADNKFTQMAIAGDVSISDQLGGTIVMGGPTPADNEIFTLGQPAMLSVFNQTMEGAGSISDANLTFVFGGGELDADILNQALIINTGSNLIDNEGDFDATQGGKLDIDSPIQSSGTIEVSGAGSSVVIKGTVTGGGYMFIDSGGALHIDAAAAASFRFLGQDATIFLGTGGSVTGSIAGMGPSDTIDLQTLGFASGDHAVWQQNGSTGTLSLEDGNDDTLASFTLSGTYSSGEFAATGDGSGGTSIVMPNAPPSGTITADMIMRDNGSYEIYDIGNNAIQAAYPLGQVAPEWQVAGIGGFNASDTSDMILRDGNNGAFAIYDVSNNSLTDAVPMGQVGLEWSVAGFGDFSSRIGETDMLMRNSNSGAFEIYDISNNTITSAAPMGQVGLEWSVAGFGDFSTRAGETDMLMRNNNTGVFELYDISNNTITSAAPMGQVGLEWSVAGFGDFSGNANESDMLMRNNNTGAFEIYDISNNAITSAAPMGQVGIEWSVVGFGPIGAAGASDMLMRNNNTGAFEIYDIGNNTITSAAPMGQVGLEWSVAGIAADPPAAANAQFAEAMASYAPAKGALDTSTPVVEAASSPSSTLLAGQSPHTGSM